MGSSTRKLSGSRYAVVAKEEADQLLGNAFYQLFFLSIASTYQSYKLNVSDQSYTRHISPSRYVRFQYDTALDFHYRVGYRVPLVPFNQDIKTEVVINGGAPYSLCKSTRLPTGYTVGLGSFSRAPPAKSRSIP